MDQKVNKLSAFLYIQKIQYRTKKNTTASYV